MAASVLQALERSGAAPGTTQLRPPCLAGPRAEVPPLPSNTVRMHPGNGNRVEGHAASAGVPYRPRLAPAQLHRARHPHSALTPLGYVSTVLAGCAIWVPSAASSCTPN
jgi:hypothetical protein